jgi:hypothetical protein
MFYSQRELLINEMISICVVVKDSIIVPFYGITSAAQEFINLTVNDN